MINNQFRQILGLVIILFLLPVTADFKVPRLTQPVMDQVNLLPPATEKQLNAALLNLYRNGGSQIQVLLVPDLGGLTIEQASIQIVEKWKLGRTDSDKGVLLLVAQKERKIRIEVGQGLEGQLTDAHSKRIIDEVMVPLFRSGNPDSGVLLGVVNIAKYTDPEVNLTSSFDKNSFRSQDQVKRKASLGEKIFFLLLMIVMLIVFIKNPMLFLLFLSGGGGRGGRSGGGYGGGGGGGFSGGGASGGW